MIQVFKLNFAVSKRRNLLGDEQGNCEEQRHQDKENAQQYLKQNRNMWPQLMEVSALLQRTQCEKPVLGMQGFERLLLC